MRNNIHNGGRAPVSGVVRVLLVGGCATGGNYIHNASCATVAKCTWLLIYAKIGSRSAVFSDSREK